jgi:hypothetical protein
VAARKASRDSQANESAAFIDPVIGFSWNYASYTPSRIRVVAYPTRNEVNVAVHHCLASDHALLIPTLKPETVESPWRNTADSRKSGMASLKKRETQVRKW